MQRKNLKSKDVNLRDRQARMAVLCAEMRSSQEVANIITEEFKIRETRENVYAFAVGKRGKKLIASLHKKFLNNLAEIPIANKKIRLLRQEKIYNEAMTESLKSRGIFGDIYELKLGAAVESLKAAKEEMEPHKNGVGINATIIVRIGDKPGLLSPTEAGLVSYQRS